MDDLENLPTKLAAVIRQNREKWGLPPKDWRYPTMEEAAAEDQKREAQREFRIWFRKIEVDGWKVRGASRCQNSTSAEQPFPSNLIGN